MGHLYAALFSGGLTKVGRSKTVAGRISQHAARLSVAGLEVIESHGAPCLGDIASAEQALIARCAEAATERRGNEWFVGLDFVQVRTWVDEACEEFSSELQSQSPRYVVRLDSFPIPREGAYVCRACCRHYPAINALDPFVCGSCGEFGYRYYVGRLEFGGVTVPMWHASVGAADAMQYQGVMCEELRHDVAWLRVPHPDWPVGKPLVDYAADRGEHAIAGSEPAKV